MTRQAMTSRQRLLASIANGEPDHVPCSFMIYGALKSACRDYTEFVIRQTEMGLDAFVELPIRPPVVVNDYYNLHGLPVNHDPRVTVKEWIEHPKDERWPMMIKEYHTPAGTLRAEVHRTEDWRWGNHVPFLDDYLIPRSRKFLVTGPEDLAALRYLLVDLQDAEISAFHRESEPYIDFARHQNLLLAGGWGVGADLAGWVYGLENMIFATHDQPDFMAEFLDLIAQWNRRRMEVILDAGIDLYIKRAWYENCDFWTPATWRRFLYPVLKAEVDLAHDRGVRFGYIITSNCMPLLDMFSEISIDVLIGVDPAAWNLGLTADRIGGKVCLWGGVNGHLTIEGGTQDEVRTEVQEAMRTLAPRGGFILSPVDNVREDTPRSRENVLALIKEWQHLTGQ